MTQGRDRLPVLSLHYIATLYTLVSDVPDGKVHPEVAALSDAQLYNVLHTEYDPPNMIKLEIARRIRVGAFVLPELDADRGWPDGLPGALDDQQRRRFEQLGILTTDDRLSPSASDKVGPKPPVAVRKRSSLADLKAAAAARERN